MEVRARLLGHRVLRPRFAAAAALHLPVHPRPLLPAAQQERRRKDLRWRRRWRQDGQPRQGKGLGPDLPDPHIFVGGLGQGAERGEQAEAAEARTQEAVGQTLKKVLCFVANLTSDAGHKFCMRKRCPSYSIFCRFHSLFCMTD